jgi:hypothetical protein
MAAWVVSTVPLWAADSTVPLWAADSTAAADSAAADSTVVAAAAGGNFQHLKPRDPGNRGARPFYCFLLRGSRRQRRLLRPYWTPSEEIGNFRHARTDPFNGYDQPIEQPQD